MENLESIIETFRKNWKTTNGRFLSLSGNPTIKSIDDVYRESCRKAYSPSVLRALKYPRNISNKVKEELKKDSLNYLSICLDELFNIDDVNFTIFDNWESEVVNYIVNMYKEKGVNDYTYGNGQKLVNMAIKYVLSSDIIQYNHPVFKYCHIPVDGIIQKIAKKNLNVEFLTKNGKELKTYSSWSKNDCRDDFLTYQDRIRNAIQKKDEYYSPLIWEIQNWSPQ